MKWDLAKLMQEALKKNKKIFKKADDEEFEENKDIGSYIGEIDRTISNEPESWGEMKNQFIKYYFIYMPNFRNVNKVNIKFNPIVPLDSFFQDLDYYKALRALIDLGVFSRRDGKAYLNIISMFGTIHTEEQKVESIFELQRSLLSSPLSDIINIQLGAELEYKIKKYILDKVKNKLKINKHKNKIDFEIGGTTPFEIRGTLKNLNLIGRNVLPYQLNSDSDLRDALSFGITISIDNNDFDSEKHPTAITLVYHTYNYDSPLTLNDIDNEQNYQYEVESINFFDHIDIYKEIINSIYKFIDKGYEHIQSGMKTHQERLDYWNKEYKSYIDRR